MGREEFGVREGERRGKRYIRYLCKRYGLTEKDILCHSEGYARGIASNHADVMHWFPKFGKSMDTFRADVKALLDEGSAPAFREYTVQKGDSLWIITQRFLGNGA